MSMVLSLPGWRVAVIVPVASVPAFEEALADDETALSSFEIPGTTNWIIEAIGPEEPDRKAIELRIGATAGAIGLPAPAVVVERMPERDWVAESLRGLAPVRAGRFFVHGRHDRDRRPAGAISLQIEANQAFGTGHHATTRGCLLALDALAKERRFTRPLDLGCGSGVLALAAASLWRIPVLASDIDPVAVRIAAENAGVNGLRPWIRPVHAAGLRHRTLRSGGPYDLILANILARPLVALAPALAQILDRPGIIVLSGLLSGQERMVRAAYRNQGLRLLRRHVEGEWPTLVLARD